MIPFRRPYNLIWETTLRKKKPTNTSQATCEQLRAKVDICECEGLSGTSASQEGFLEEQNLEFKRKGNGPEATLSHSMGSLFSGRNMSPFYKCLDNLLASFLGLSSCHNGIYEQGGRMLRNNLNLCCCSHFCHSSNHTWERSTEDGLPGRSLLVDPECLQGRGHPAWHQGALHLLKHA